MSDLTKLMTGRDPSDLERKQTEQTPTRPQGSVAAVVDS